MRESAAQIAAEISSVSAMPTSTETRMPIQNGCNSVAHMIRLPTFIAAAPSAGAIATERAIPAPIVTSGVTRISIFVSLLTALPSSAARIATNSTAKGPPAPPSAFAEKPTVIGRTAPAADSAAHSRSPPPSPVRSWRWPVHRRCSRCQRSWRRFPSTLPHGTACRWCR